MVQLSKESPRVPKLRNQMPGGTMTILSSKSSFKVNHSFEPNAHYDAIDHPRFGVIASVVSLKPIKKGEEIFTHYHYPGRLLNTASGLDWYSESYQEGSQVAQEGSQVAQEGSQEAQEGSQVAQEGSQVAQEVRQDAQEVFQDSMDVLSKEEL